MTDSMLEMSITDYKSDTAKGDELAGRHQRGASHQTAVMLSEAKHL